MEMKEYKELSARTAAEGFDRKDFSSDFVFMNELIALDMFGAMADAMKRSLYYSDDLNARTDVQRDRIAKNSVALQEAAQKAEEAGEEYNVLNVSPNLIHAALGIASESGELFEEYFNASLEGREVNKVNLAEEAGDIMWYLAMLLREVDVSFEDVAAKNIAKLQKRFPDKFSKDNALNRDLDEEQKVLAG